MQPIFSVFSGGKESVSVFNKHLIQGEKLKYPYVCTSNFEINGQENSHEPESGGSVSE